MRKLQTEMTELKNLVGELKNFTRGPQQQNKSCSGQNEWATRWSEENSQIPEEDEEKAQNKWKADKRALGWILEAQHKNHLGC